MATVLFADADQELCEVYERLFTSRGYRVETARSGLECLTKLRLFTPDLLILDLELPWGGGEGVLALLREEPQFLPDRIVLTFASPPDRSWGRLAQGEAVRMLAKPFRLAAVLECVPPPFPWVTRSAVCAV